MLRLAAFGVVCGAVLAVGVPSAAAVGGLDNGFGSGGALLVGVGSGGESAGNGVALAPSGGLRVAGEAVDGPYRKFVLLRLDANGPNANALAIVLELPSQRIPVIATNPNKLIAVWTRTIADGGRRDREGRPFVNTGLIPKTPRNSPAPDRRDAFNLALPQNDVSAFKADMVSVLTSFYARTPADASFLANAFLPDVLMFQIGNPNGYGTTIGPGPGAFTGPFPGGQVLGNGHRLSDDVHDITLNLFTNGALPSDNVGDDNGLRVTDGSVDPVSGKTRAIAFPYVAAPSNSPGGPKP